MLSPSGLKVMSGSSQHQITLKQSLYIIGNLRRCGLRICIHLQYSLRRSEKHKKLKMILPIVRKVVYIYTKQGSGLKKSNLGHFPMRKWPTKWLLRLYKWKKKCSDFGVHGIQIEWLGLTVPTQKSVLTKSRDIGQNVSNFAGLVWKADFGHFLGNIPSLCIRPND